MSYPPALLWAALAVVWALLTLLAIVAQQWRDAFDHLTFCLLTACLYSKTRECEQWQDRYSRTRSYWGQP